MIGIDASPPPPLVRRPVWYAARAAIRSATVRCGTWLASASKPPILSFRSRNWSTLMPFAPVSFSTFRPYWMPMLSSGRRANPFAGSRPYTLTVWSCTVQRTPVGLVAGL